MFYFYSIRSHENTIDHHSQRTSTQTVDKPYMDLQASVTSEKDEAYTELTPNL